MAWLENGTILKIQPEYAAYMTRIKLGMLSYSVGMSMYPL